IGRDPAKRLVHRGVDGLAAFREQQLPGDVAVHQGRRAFGLCLELAGQFAEPAPAIIYLAKLIGKKSTQAYVKGLYLLQHEALKLTLRVSLQYFQQLAGLSTRTAS